MQQFYTGFYWFLKSYDYSIYAKITGFMISAKVEMITLRISW